jgi:hypothetical protein
LETVVNGSTGILFEDQTAEGLIEAVRRLERIDFDPAKIREHARRFDKEIFKQSIRAYIDEKYGLFQKTL